VFFDDQANTFIFSPASHYMNAALSFGPHHELVSGLSVDNGEIPSGFTVMSALVRRFLTDLAGKKRPFPLKYFGYWTNLLQVIRSDGVIVKPDDSIAPLDSTYIAEANNRGAAVVAATRTRHEGVTTSYVFAFRQTAEQRTASFLPSALGYTGPVYAYDYFDKRGKYVEPGEAIEFVVPDNGAYWIIVPIGASGVGFLGDATKFVSNGRNRVARILDNGTLEARIIFSAGETRMHLYGFSRVQPVIQATRAAVKKLVYDSHTQLFQFDLVSKPGTTPTVIVRVNKLP
jgi:hypothetical protein